MAITLTALNDDTFHGWTWTVPDESALAAQIARVALGQARHIAKILAGAGITARFPTQSEIDSAIAMISQENVYHRDGWIFQVMSWIAANLACNGAMVRAPQMLTADKGLDGLQLEIDEASNKITAAIIFEDKATKTPRKVIREEVWKGIKDTEAGLRQNYITSQVTALLETRSDIDPDEVIRDVIWPNTLRYRVSITVGNQYAGGNGPRKLFKGYEKFAAGDKSRRRAEIIVIPKLRTWMETLAGQIVTEIRAIAAAGPHV